MVLASARTRHDRIQVGQPGDASETVSFCCGDTRWRAVATVADELFDQHGLKLRRWQREDRVEIVKSGPHRTVMRLALPFGGFYFKHYKACDWQSLLQNLFRPCKAVREWQAARLIAELGIPSAEAVAVGRTVCGILVRDSYLLTREVENTVPLIEFVQQNLGRLPPRQLAAARRQLAVQLGELTARLHRGQLVHRDLHAGNILVAIDPRASLRLWLIDLHAVETRKEIGLREIEYNLSLLNNSLHHYASQSDRLRFFRAYWECLSKPTSSASSLPRRLADRPLLQILRRIERYCRRALCRGIDKADRKWARGGRRVIVADRNARRCRGLACLGRDWIAAVRDQPQQFFERECVSAWQHRSEIERVADFELNVSAERLACRAVAFETPPGRKYTALFRRHSLARHSWEIGHQLLRRGINTPQPLMFVETKSGTQYLLTESDPSAIPLSRFLQQAATPAAGSRREGRLRDCTRHLAGQLRRMHAERFEHGELTPANIRVSIEPSSCRVWLLAMHRVRRRRWMQRPQVAQQLADLDGGLRSICSIRNTHRLRFLRRYLGDRYRSEWKRLWRAVDNCSRAESLHRSLRRAAMLTVATAAVIIGACRSTDKPVTLPAQHSVRSEQLLVLSDFKLPRDHPLILDLNRLRRQVSQTLDLPLRHNEVVVYLFSTETEFRQYLSTAYPGLPGRRAYFVGTPRELAVYTFWGERIHEDLRHEYTHGLLHASLENVPLWLDEGLAEYFEVAGPGQGRVNVEYAERLARSLENGWRPDLKRLERIEEFSQMQRVDYQEAWGWVHFLLHGTPRTRRLLQSYLHELKTGAQPSSLSTQLQDELPEYDSLFLAYLDSLQIHVAARNVP